MKKIISLFVIATMIFAAMTFTASAKDITSPDQFAAETVNKLTSDISGKYVFSLGFGNITIDLNGYTWSSSEKVFEIDTGNVTIIDSSAAKTGKLVSTANDCLSMGNGSLTIKDVTIMGGPGGMDAVYVDGGTCVLENCTLSSGKAGIVAANGSASANVPAVITVKGGTFANYAGGKDARNCAIELRNSHANGGPDITLDGNITFENKIIMIQNTCSRTLAEVFTFADGVEATLSAPAAHSNANYTVSTVDAYTYTAPAGDDTTAGGATEETADEIVSAPVAGKAYNAFLNQAKAEKVLYLDGGVTENGRYLTMTEDASKAIEIFAEEVDGGYKFFTEIDGAKKYISVFANDEGKSCVGYADEGSVFTYNEETFAWETDLNGVAQYLGTYGTYETVSASKTSYINANNTRTEQFPLELVAVSVSDDEGSGNAPTGDVAVIAIAVVATISLASVAVISKKKYNA